MSSSDLIILTILFITLVVLVSGAKTAHMPKPQSTEKPPLAESSGVGGNRKLGRVANPTPSPSSSVYTEETTELMMDTFSLSPTNSSTYQIDTYPNEFHTGAIGLPEKNGSYSLDYSECFYNFCECCPPEKGPVGPAGEKGPQGLPGESGLPGNRMALLEKYVKVGKNKSLYV